jgi:hypothetical protein
MTRFKMVSSFLGLTQSTVWLLFMVVLVGMDERMAERFLPMYLLALGGGVISIGLLNRLDNFLSAVYAFPGDIYPSALGLNDHCSIFKSVTRMVFWDVSKMRPAPRLRNVFRSIHRKQDS